MATTTVSSSSTVTVPVDVARMALCCYVSTPAAPLLMCCHSTTELLRAFSANTVAVTKQATEQLRRNTGNNAE